MQGFAFFLDAWHGSRARLFACSLILAGSLPWMDWQYPALAMDAAVASSPRFECRAEASGFGILARRSVLPHSRLQLVMWIDADDSATSRSQRRCQVLVSRLSERFKEGAHAYISYGRWGGQAVICTAPDVGRPCDGPLLDLDQQSGSNSATTLLAVLGLSVDPVEQCATAEPRSRLYISVDELLHPDPNQVVAVLRPGCERRFARRTLMQGIAWPPAEGQDRDSMP